MARKMKVHPFYTNEEVAAYRKTLSALELDTEELQGLAALLEARLEQG